MTTRVLGNYGPVTPSMVTPFFAVHKSATTYSRLETRQQWWTMHSYALKFICRVALLLLQVSPVKALWIRKPQISNALPAWDMVFHCRSSWHLYAISGHQMIPTFWAQWWVFTVTPLQQKPSSLVSFQTMVNQKDVLLQQSWTEVWSLCTTWTSVVQ